MSAAHAAVTGHLSSTVALSGEQGMQGQGRTPHCPHFTDQEVEAGRHEGTCMSLLSG